MRALAIAICVQLGCRLARPIYLAVIKLFYFYRCQLEPPIRGNLFTPELTLQSAWLLAQRRKQLQRLFRVALTQRTAAGAVGQPALTGGLSIPGY